MKVTVVGVFSGISKKSNNPYYLLHCTEAKSVQGLIGCLAQQFFCDENVAKGVQVGKMYELGAEFGSKTVTSFKAV